MRVCLIVPLASELSIPAEIQAVSNTFSAAGHVVHVAEASRHGLRDALQSSPFDLAWFAGHSGPDGFGLTDGVWRAAEAGRWLVAVRAWMFVANSCESVELVTAIQRIANVDMVAAITPALDDAIAAETALYLARSLVETNDLAEATRRASANGYLEYRFYPCGGSMAEQARAGQAPQDNLTDLVRALRGDPFTGAPGLLATVATLAANVANLTTTVAQLSAQLESNQVSVDARLTALEEQRRADRQTTVSPRMVWWLLALMLLFAVSAISVLLRLGGA